MRQWIMLFLLFLFFIPHLVMAQQSREESDKEQLFRCLASYQTSTASLNAAQKSAGDLGVKIQQANERIQQLEAELKVSKEKSKEESKPAEEPAK